ncbi:MAG: carboxypeptidase regulatory-like domain-containing protein [Acidobacteria bacterium]|nr:carboxypeptidase regulatory-like domain-containing protein [Acidobacteriota bacterium]
MGLLFAVVGLPLLAEKPAKRGKEKAAEPFALIAVSVFREPGFAVPGAEIELAPAADEKFKKLKVTGDSRGEYVFRVPTPAARYAISASGKGLKTQTKTLAVEGEGRFDVTFMLESESK